MIEDENMILKQYLGEIMTQLGFITNNQLEEALIKQRELVQKKKKQQQTAQDKLLSVTRSTTQAHKTPMLGQILYDMGYVTSDQLDAALEEQSSAVDLYDSLEKEKLIIALDTISSLIASLDQTLILSNFMSHANRLVNSEAIILMLLDEKSGELVFSIPEDSDSDDIKDVRVPATKGIAGWVAENRKYILVSDADKESKFDPKIDQVAGIQSRSILCVPIMTRQTFIGVVEAINKSGGGSFSEEDALLLNIVSSNVAMAIENGRRYDELKEKLMEKS